MPGRAPALTFHLIPHTHWDREWYLTRAAFQARLVPVLDEVLAQLEQDPEARFVLDGQTALLEDYLAVRPEQEGRLAALVQRGALEIGPWYILSDLLIPAAVSLRRNLELGAGDAGRFGKRLDVLYSPDAFGHPAELPALAAEFNIRRAVVRRGLGRPDGADHDLFRWEGPGGKNLLLYHLPAGGYDLAIGLAGSEELEPLWAAVRREVTGRAVTTQIAVYLGADHHAMARDLSGLRARLQALEPGHEIRVSGLTEYFAAVEKLRPHPPAFRGELRQCEGHTWVLQGVHSARSRIKRRHSRAEWLLSRIAEPLSRLSAERGGTDRGGLVRLAWKTLLQCQFHDTLAGTTSDAVQREQLVRLDTVDTLATEIAAGSLSELAGHDPDLAREHPAEHPARLILWNPSSRTRSGLMTAEVTFFRKDVPVGPPPVPVARIGGGYRPFVLQAGDGGMIPVQVLTTRAGESRSTGMRHYPDQDEVDRVWIAFRAPAVAALGLRSLSPRAGEQPLEESGVTVEHGQLANGLVSVRVSRSGVLALEDHRTGERYSELCDLEDEADRGDLYTFSRGPGRSVRGGRALSQAIVCAGPLIGAIETRWSMRSAGEGEIGLRQLVVLEAGSPVVKVRLDLDNGAADHRLRARFPVGTGQESIAGTAFGMVRRPVPGLANGADEMEWQVPTAPAHRYVAAGSRERGLAVLSPDFFEYEWSDGKAISVTLLRAVGELSRNDLPERPGHAAWPTPTPEAQEPGRHTIHLAIAPLGEVEGLERMWEECFLPIQAMFV
ncbi:MAG TPA: glycoside hydrolase family 38 C-terminal domain-containing protein [Gemmatimonadales bacterium]|nr:glycoside hydrolase family 38 C-terminal domain-containing protein [Gemmatimonadales bacterium]